MTDPRTVLILGAGIGGIVLASRLRRRLPGAYRFLAVSADALGE